MLPRMVLRAMYHRLEQVVLTITHPLRQQGMLSRTYYQLLWEMKLLTLLIKYMLILEIKKMSFLIGLRKIKFLRLIQMTLSELEV